MGSTAAVSKKKRKKNKEGKASKKAKPSLADRADRHELYESTVQCPEADVEFFAWAYKKLRRRKALSFREDFCGTAQLAVEWCLSDPKRTAIGIDLDAPTIAWGHQRHVVPNAKKLGDRLSVYNADVLEPREEKADVACAGNFSFCVFKKREELKQYLRGVLDGLDTGGLLFLEIYGGVEAIAVTEEERDCDGYEYIWEQASYNPLTAETLCHIHFRFSDGSKLKKAFTYDWRLWSIPELTELLLEVGFSDYKIFWEQLEEDDDVDEEMLFGSGAYEDVTNQETDQQESFLVYVVGMK